MLVKGGVQTPEVELWESTIQTGEEVNLEVKTEDETVPAKDLKKA